MAKLLKNKKAQFYLFIAILLSLSAYTLISAATAKEKTSDFDMLYQNYIFEAGNVFNSAIYSNGDVFWALEEYTTSYISYAKTKNTDFYVAYIAKIQNETKVVNYLKSDVNIIEMNITLKRGQSATFNSQSQLTLQYSSINYSYNLQNDTAQFKALTVKEHK